MDLLSGSIFRKISTIVIISMLVGLGLVPNIAAEEPFLAKTIYVDDDSTYPGNGSINWPYKYIWQGIENSSEGDTIFVRCGTYNESLTIKNKKELKLIGENRSLTVIDGDIHNDTVYIYDSNITIANFTISGSGISGIENGGKTRGIYVAECQSSTGPPVTDNPSCNIFNNTITNNGDGIYILHSYTYFIHNNSIISNLDNGIVLAESSEGYIVDNYIAKNGKSMKDGDGIEIHENALFTFIKDNIIEDNKADGIWSDGSEKARIYNNTIIKNENNGINFKKTSVDSWIKNNTISDNKRNGISVWGSSNEINISFNKITGHSNFSIYGGCGINLWQSNEIEIYCNYITNNFFGINSEKCNSIQIFKNYIANNKFGIFFNVSNDICISINYIARSFCGIFLRKCEVATINYNDIMGIFIFYATENEEGNFLQLFAIRSTGNANNNYWVIEREPLSLKSLHIFIFPPLSFSIKGDCEEKNTDPDWWEWAKS